MASEDTYLPFSQRTGHAPTPTQLKLGEVSGELRRLLDYCIGLEIHRNSSSVYSGSFFKDRWKRVAQDLHVLFFERKASTFKNEPHELWTFLEEFIHKASIGKLFDLVEFLVRQSRCGNEFKDDLAGAYRAEFEKSEVLKAEFLCAADYAAFKVSENPTLIRRMLENYEMIEAEAATADQRIKLTL